MELYVHIPFCRKKCRYCSFASFTEQEDYYEKYTDLILREAQIRQHEVSEPVTTVYIGGGTPSLFTPIHFARMISGLHEIFGFESVEEFTSEANPGTVTMQWLDNAVTCGVNRLSLGVQAVQERLLQILGRIHCFKDAADSVELAHAAGISNINLDLIFGIPTQMPYEWEQTIDTVLSLNPTHFSAYGLIPEEGTPLYDDLQCGKYQLPDPDEERAMYDLVIRKSVAYGFQQYEISNFALPGYECRHNIGYWTQTPYIGLGVSAASMTGLHSDADGMSYQRSVNPETLKSYERMISEGNNASVSEHISTAEARFETMMLGLRMNRGVHETEFRKKHHMDIHSCYGKKLEKLRMNGLMIHDNGYWKLTRRGFDIQNSVLVELMDD